MRHADSYCIPMRKKRWAKLPEYATAYSVVYTPLGEPRDRELPATLVIRSNESGQILSGFLELVVDGSSMEDATELAGLSWQLITEKTQARVAQPVSVWVYPSGETIVAHVEGAKRQTLRAWTAEARRGRGAKRIHTAVAAARAASPEETISDEGPLLDTLEREGRIHHEYPVEVFRPYANKHVQPQARQVKRASNTVGPEARGTESPVVNRLPFRPLPTGELSVESLKRHYENGVGDDPDRRYDPERMEKVLSLGPSVVYVGTEGFAGYMVFTFPHTEAALLECPVRGNAAYVIDRDWMRLARKSKRELLDERPTEVRKVVHKGDWFERLKLTIGF